MPVDVKEVKRRLGILLKDENLVSEYIRRFGPVVDIKSIKALKGDTQQEADAGEDDASNGADPVYEVKLDCPVCGNQGITSYELKAKALSIAENKLLQQEYIGALGHRSLDFDLLSITLCPRCLFASPDKKDFVTQNKITNKPVPSQIPPNTILTLQEKIGERKAMLEGVVNIEDYFKRPRKIDAAILSYKIAAMRAKVEAFYELPNSLLKLGFYYLKIGKLLKKKKEDETPALREALEYFTECFKNSNTSSEANEYRIIYVILALYIRLGELKKGHPYIGVLEKIRTGLKAKAVADPSVNLTFIDNWILKCKNLWEDREQPDLFK
ncbi:MAG: DUF2225 domain-containing protein [Fibrobacterota bacterium]